MSKKRLFNVLKLAYSPLSNYDFVMVRDDAIIRDFINSGKIYLITQRPVLTFENFYMNDRDPNNIILNFEIHQKGNNKKLVCKFPLFQDVIDIPPGSQCHIGINYIFPKPKVISNEMPFNGMANFVIKTANDDYCWLSPEKLIYHYLRETLDADIQGNIEDFLIYKVHYIGKATEQDVIKRLTGHSHLQDILSLEQPFHYGSLPTDEIAILFFAFEDNIFMDTFGADDNLTSAVKMMMGELPIDQDIIYLDAEKALITALKPIHN